MKIKINSTVLVILYIVYVITSFITFAVMFNNAAPFSVYILLFVLLAVATLYFIFSMQFSAKIHNLIKEKSIDENKTELIAEIEAEKEKIIEKEIDIKNIIPKEKLKFEIFADELLKNFSDELQAVQSVLYIKDASEVFKCMAKYAYYSDIPPSDFKIGEAMTGQAVKNKTVVTLANIPESYITIASGLGKGVPCYLTFVPIIYQEDVIGLIEFASFTTITELKNKSLTQFSEKVADSIFKFIKNTK